MSIDSVSAANAAPAAQPAPIHAFNESDGPSFSDLLDILNPLQHIPIINTIYQHLTGDTEGAVAEVAGATLWTGPLGLVGSLIDLAVKNETGKSVSDNVLAWLGFEDEDSATALARNEESQSNPTSATAQAVQQTAAASAAPAIMPAMLPAAPVAPRSRARDDDNSGGDASGPQQKGEYLVFGGPASPAIVTPAAAATPVQAAAAYAPPQQKGQYMVFGGAGAAVASAAPVPLTPPAPPAPAGLSPLPQRSFAVPARRSQVTPSALPPPTTGPAAIPGHAAASQAVAANGDSDWFLGAMSANLDKYQAAQKLGQGDAVAASEGATLH
jgi:hypothetical protein